MVEAGSGRVRSRRDVIAGGIFVAIAAGFAAEALRYPLGSAIRMGPGFMPLVLAGMLAVLGLVTIVSGLRRHESVEVTPVPWVGGALVLGALIVFGVFARTLGLVPIVLVCTTMTAMASRNNTILSSLAIAACLAFASWLIFKVGLGITLPTFGPVFGL